MYENMYLTTAAFFSVAMLAIVLFMAIFELVTRYKNWEEIERGNVAVALATGGKIFGIANIFRFSIQHNDTIWQALIWSMYGFVLLLIAYFIFEFLTPKFGVDEQIKQDNRSVGLISMFISIGLSYVIGASIS